MSPSSRSRGKKSTLLRCRCSQRRLRCRPLCLQVLPSSQSTLVPHANHAPECTSIGWPCAWYLYFNFPVATCSWIWASVIANASARYTKLSTDSSPKVARIVEKRSFSIMPCQLAKISSGEGILETSGSR